MALDWSNERYIRLYTRITPDMALWCWQAKAIWPWLLAAADRAGVIGTRKGTRGIAALIGMPTEVVDAGIADLLGDGCIVATEAGYAIPNYVEAQTAQASPNKRAADYRARQRLGESLDSRNDADSSVTENHAASRGVTGSNGASREITPSGTDPSGTERGIDPNPGGGLFGPMLDGPTPDKPDPILADADAMIGEVNRLSGRSFDPRSKGNLRIVRRFRRDHSVEDGIAIARGKVGFLASPKREVREAFCPATLFGPDNADRYLDEIRAGQPRAGPFPAGTANHATPRFTPITAEDL